MMKHVSLIWPLIISYLLLSGCSPKETFYFSKSTGSFGHNQKVQQEGILPDSLGIHNKPNGLEQPNSTNSPNLIATTAIGINPGQIPLPKQTPAVGFNASIPAKKVITHPYTPIVKNKARQNHTIKKYSAGPVANKKVHGAALASFIISMAALGLFFALLWPIAVLLGLTGSILGIVGLFKIKRNPDKNSGKGFAWVGTILGLLLVLFMIAFLLAFAGAI